MIVKNADVTINRYVVNIFVCVFLLVLVTVCCVIHPIEAVDPSSDTIAGDIDYNIWTLNLPTGGILSSGDLKKQSYNSWWYPGTGAFEGYAMFQTPQRGAGETAFNSQYVRCELREIIPSSGDRSGSWGTNANWGRLGYHKMITEVKVERVNDNPRGDYAKQSYTCIGQLWGTSNGNAAMFSLMYIDAKPGESSFRMRDPSVAGRITYAPVHIPIGKAFIVTYECIDGTLQVWVESKEANVAKTKLYTGSLADPVDNNSYYFKVGNYDQSSDAKGDITPNPNDVHTLVGFKSITVEHNPIRGRLTYTNGSPVANQVIDYTLNGGGTSNLKLSVTTDMDGYYYIPNVPSNGGVRTASVSIAVPTISGYTSDKNGTIDIAAIATSSVTGVRSENEYNIVYGSGSSSGSDLQKSRKPVPNASIDYVAETLKGLNGVYIINGKTVSIEGPYPIETSWFNTTIMIIEKGDNAVATDSVAQSLFIKARPSMSMLSKTDCTTSKNNDGGITNVTNAMEYSADSGATWKTISGSYISGLPPGTYYVRIKATSSSFKSNYDMILINPYNAFSSYSVHDGDSLWLIGLTFGVTVDAIKKVNGLTGDMIYPGQQLQIPQDDEVVSSTSKKNYIIHTVKSGDTLWTLARKYDTTVGVIKALNGLTGDMIYPGQQLQILCK